MLLTEITLGSKAHHNLVAQTRSRGLTLAAFLKTAANSTMSPRDVASIMDAVAGVNTSKPLTREDVEQISAIADVSLEELLTLANM